jgi:hypothetical protein
MIWSKFCISANSTNVNQKIIPCLAKHHAMNMYGAVEIYFHAFLDLGLNKRPVMWKNHSSIK